MPNDSPIPAGLVIIGAGPSGLACSHALGLAGRSHLVVEKDPVPGGLCRTLDFNGFLYDIGGHRFITKLVEIDNLWKEVMGSDFLPVKRLSRIYYNKRFFKYPLNFFDTFYNLGPSESARCMMSYLGARFRRPGDDETFEGWIINRFGRRLYKIFFDTYTTKVWAIPCKDISADWAVQRIRGLSLRAALRNAFRKSRANGPKTLAQEFFYPRRGPGEFFERLAERSALRGGRFLYGHRAVCLRHRDGRISSLETASDSEPRAEIPVGHLFSSMPLQLLIAALRPEPPREVRDAAERLRFRCFMTVNIILNTACLFPDQWIYVHSPEVRMGRIQNFRNWSPAMVPDPAKTSLSLEYFCSEGDDLWRLNDIDLIDLAMEELARIGIASRDRLISGFAVRRTNVYPVYTLDYRTHLGVVRKYLDGFSNLTMIGRAGLFRYDNSDLAMMTGIQAARCYLEGNPRTPWELEAPAEYLEE